MKILTAVLLVFISAQQQSQQTVTAPAVSGPTYEETATWLKTKIEAGGNTQQMSWRGPGNQETTSYENVSLNKNRLQFTEIFFDAGTKDKYTSTYSVPLDQASNVEIKHFSFKGDEAWFVNITAPTSMKRVVTTKGTEETATNETIKGASLTFADENSANRVKKALDHIVELNKAAPKKDEPF